jgi:enolase
MAKTTITAVIGTRMWDSRGHPTVEAEVRLAGGATGRALAPAGASRGASDAAELRDPDSVLGRFGVRAAVAGINREISRALVGLDASDQRAVDEALIRPDSTADKARLGANATVAVSMASLNAAAAAHGEPLFRYLMHGRPSRIPLPQIQIFGGGAHAGGRIDIQDLMVTVLTAKNFNEAIETTARIYHAAGALMREAGKLCGVTDEGGFWPAFDSNEEAIETLVRAIERAGHIPGKEVGICLDIAASMLRTDGRYRFGPEGKDFDSDGLSEMLLGWIERYPIVSIEDPLAEDDRDGMIRFMRAAGSKVQVVGDDSIVTDAKRIRAAAVNGACNAVLLKPNRAATLTEARGALEAARAAGFAAVVSARSGETEDVTIAHLAVGWDAGQIKVGSMARAECTAKWNELLRIEAQLGTAARFGGAQALPQFGGGATNRQGSSG